MIKASVVLVLTGLCLSAGCTNHLYQGEMTALDAYGKERLFIMYWTGTDPLLGMPKATPALLLTECSPIGIEFTEQPEGVVFRGMPGRDRLPGPIPAISGDQVCGRVSNYASLAEAEAGPLSVVIYCEPAAGDDVTPAKRNYLAARREPYTFPMIEKMRHWSWHAEPLPAPAAPPCRTTGK